MRIFGERKGFTPVEVLVAMAVLAIGVVAAFRLFPIALRHVRVAQERTIVSELADTRFGHLRAAGGRTLLYSWGGMSGAFQTEASPEGVYRNLTTAVHRTASAPEVYLHRVTMEVTMHDGRKERFVTYVAEP